MKKSILIIDDEKDQVDNLQRYLSKNLPKDYTVFTAHEEEDMLDKIDNTYYSLAILDLRMDGYKMDGVQLAQRIVDTNPFAKIIFMSAFTQEFYTALKPIVLSGKILDTFDKGSFSEFAEQIKLKAIEYHDSVFSSLDSIQNALIDSYAECKNEPDTYKKGVKFENFVSLLFRDMGFDKIFKRTIDQSRNEIDLVIRNDIDDGFLSKFGKYFLIECKNFPDGKVDKNIFIIFSSKLKNTTNMSEFGIIATTGSFTKTAYLEAMRQSGKEAKILFLSNVEFDKIINSDNRLEAFKSLIDEQVKDN